MTKKIEPTKFLPLLKQPDPNPTSDPVELDESDVVWSDTRSDDSLSPPATSSPSSSYLSLSPHRLRRGLGLSAALAADLRRNPSAARLIPPSHGGATSGRTLPHSAPVNVPVWNRIKIWYHVDVTDEDDEERGDDDVADGEERGRERGVVPPHVMSGRLGHVAAYSVFEGAGRTLKGRDMRRVRNAVFQKTGFLD